MLWLTNGKVEMGDGFKFWADGDEYQCLNGRIIGEFICDKVDKYTFSHYEAEYRVTHVEQNAMCLNQPELIYYGKGETLYGWHISDLKLYDSPKKLSEFRKPCPYGDLPCWICPSCDKDENDNLIQCFNTVSRPPQSYMFVE